MNHAQIEWENPILIGSCGSSGSTLLSVMLDAHSEVLCGPELALFAHPFFWAQEGREWRERLQSYLGQDDQATRSPAWTLAEGVCPYTDIVYTNTLPWYGLSVSELRGYVQKSSSARDLVRYLYGPRLARHRKRIWAEKSPPNVYAFGAFLNCYQNGRVICLVRDVRDVVSSLLRRKWGSFKRALSAWLVDVAICECFHDHPRVFFVKYEDLVGNPRKTIEALLAFLKLSPEVDRVLNYVQTSSRVASPDASSTGHPAWSNSPRGPISSKAVGSWRRMLSPEHIAALSAAHISRPVEGHPRTEAQTITGLQECLGYEPVHAVGANPSSLLNLLNEEKLFISGDEYTDPGIFHERYVECDDARLPKASFSWREKKLLAKLSHRQIEQNKRQFQDRLDELQARYEALQIRFRALEDWQAMIRSNPIIRAGRWLRRMVLKTFDRRRGSGGEVSGQPP